MYEPDKIAVLQAQNVLRKWRTVRLLIGYFVIFEINIYINARLIKASCNQLACNSSHFMTALKQKS